MRLVFALVIARERIEGGIILRKCRLPQNPDASLRELAALEAAGGALEAEKNIVETVGESIPPTPGRAA